MRRLSALAAVPVLTAIAIAGAELGDTAALGAHDRIERVAEPSVQHPPGGDCLVVVVALVAERGEADRCSRADDRRQEPGLARNAQE